MRLSGFKLPLERLSASSLGTFAACPEQFRQKYLQNQPEKHSGERFMGSVTHKALDLLLNPEFREDFAVTAETEGEEKPIEDIAVDVAWQGIIEKEGEPEWHDVDATEQYRRARQMLKAYLPIANQMKVIASEGRFEEKIGGITVVGYIDRELTDRILEVKTAAQKVSKPKPRWSFQGRLYGLVADKPIEWHVVTRQATPKVYTASEAPELYVPAFNRDATVQIIRQAAEYMNDLYIRYGADEPWPLSGIYGDWTCGYCSFRSGCPAWK